MYEYRELCDCKAFLLSEAKENVNPQNKLKETLSEQALLSLLRSKYVIHVAFTFR